jgi:hypothetical protein
VVFSDSLALGNVGFLSFLGALDTYGFLNFVGAFHSEGLLQCRDPLLYYGFLFPIGAL